MNPYPDLFSISTQKEFEKMTLKVFRFQYDNNNVYQKFCDLVKRDKNNVKSVTDIPFLPIQFFKSHQILSSQEPIVTTFTSSGTASPLTLASPTPPKEGLYNRGTDKLYEVIRSKHYVTDLDLYEQSFRKAFSIFYGNIEDYAVLALLPSYLEREGSSLIYMVNDLIEGSKNPESGFYLNNYEELLSKLARLKEAGANIILIGVTYALLDLIEYAASTSFPLGGLGGSTIIMETGGMKGKRKEIIREELHTILCKGFGVTTIHSEYGMTELLSQAYSFGAGVFECPPWMSILIRDPEDALTYVNDGKTGGINVIDLANINSCSFIATQDLGKKNPNHSFEVLGRFDASDIRGCNLMVV